MQTQTTQLVQMIMEKIEDKQAQSAVSIVQGHRIVYDATANQEMLQEKNKVAMLEKLPGTGENDKICTSYIETI